MFNVPTHIIRDVIRQSTWSIKERKTPYPLKTDIILCLAGSNVKSFVFRNFNQKEGNPLKGGKITCLYNCFYKM